MDATSDTWDLTNEIKEILGLRSIKIKHLIKNYGGNI